MINSTLFEKIGTHLKNFFSKIYNVSLLDPTIDLSLVDMKLASKEKSKDKERNKHALVARSQRELLA